VAISFVAAGSQFTATSGTSFTINKPAGVAAGDFMIAVLSFSGDTGGNDIAVTPPSGWTEEAELFNAGDGFDHQLWVGTKFVESGDPSTWAGTVGSGVDGMVCGAVAYRGVQSLLVDGTSSTGLDNSYSTATVNNTVANSWRVVAAGYESGSLNYDITVNDTSSRLLYEVSDGGSVNVQLRIYDSNGAISTGNTSKTVSRSANFDASCSWIGILRETSGTPATGAMSCTLPKVLPFTFGDVEDPGSISATLPSLSFTGDGYGQPPVVTGDMTAALPSLSASAAGVLPVTGSLAVSVLPLVSFSGETRVFGIRVITVEADDSRLITVQSRGVDD
jgi:hypothetical protein